MKYEDFEKAEELREEIAALHATAAILQADDAEDEPVTICRKTIGIVGSPVTIPANAAKELATAIWSLVCKKEEEFEAL